MIASGEWKVLNHAQIGSAAMQSAWDSEQTLVDQRGLAQNLSQRLTVDSLALDDTMQIQNWIYVSHKRCLVWFRLKHQYDQAEIVTLAIAAPLKINARPWQLLWQQLLAQIPASDWRMLSPGVYRDALVSGAWVADFGASSDASSPHSQHLYWLNKDRVLHPEFRFPPPPIDLIQLPLNQARSTPLKVLRLDQLHPLLKGNKWFKLRWHLVQAHNKGLRQLLTLGGAYSNHVLATAAAGALLGFAVKVLIRGEAVEPLNPLLETVKSLGAEIAHCSRSDYRSLRTPAGWADFLKQHPDHECIPEGGADQLGIQGAREIWDYIPSEYAQIALAVGTASTLAGLLKAIPQQRMTRTSLLGVAVLKGGCFLTDDVEHWAGDLAQRIPWRVETEYHARGYAKTNPELRLFIADFQTLNPDFPIEPVYTAKLFWALSHLLPPGELSDGLAIHTGGVYPWSQSLQN